MPSRSIPPCSSVCSAAINFTKENLALDVNGEFSKHDNSFLEENETTVSVTWSGGGQELKKREFSA